MPEVERSNAPRGGGRPRLPRRPVACAEISRPTPNLVRIVVEGELAAWDAASPGAHLKIFVPDGDGDAPAMRTYTVRDYDPDAGRLTLEFGLHADGPATAWAARAQVGDKFEISGQARSGFRPSDGAEWVLLAADHSALPAVAAVLEALPANLPVTALIEVTDADDKLELSSPADVTTTWLLEQGDPCSQLVAALSELELRDGPGEVWVGCEAGAMRQIRSHLLKERDFAASSLYTRAYWRQDTPNHSDHDTGVEDD